MNDQPLPLKYVAGDPALDFVNTVDWTDDGLIDERLGNYERLVRWAEGAGLVAASDGDALRGRAAADPAGARDALQRALTIRALLQRLFAAVAAGAVPPDLLAAFNDALAPIAARRRLIAGADALELGWEGWADSLDAPLWPVVWAAARLLASDDRARVRVCGGPRCGWMFVDRSRNGLRHWCQTDVCGARAKARRHYARKKGQPRDG